MDRNTRIALGVMWMKRHRRVLNPSKSGIISIQWASQAGLEVKVLNESAIRRDENLLNALMAISTHLYSIDTRYNSILTFILVQ